MKPKHYFVALLLISLLAAACVPSIPVTGQETPTIDTTHANQQATINALETLVAFTPSATPTAVKTATVVPTDMPTITPTQTSSPTPTISLTPSITLTPTITPTPTITLTPTQTLTSTPIPAPAGCNRAEFVTALVIPNGTQISAGNNFTKGWRLQNVGTCTWSPDYRFIFVGGDKLGGPAYTTLGISTAPGGTIDLSLLLTAPKAPGTYEAFYKLQDASGNIFGFGAGGNETVSVQIQVPAPPTFAVTHVDLSVSTQVVTRACPPGYTFTFSAIITANGPGDVIFTWLFSDGTSTAKQTVTFTAAGTQTVSATWTLGAGGTLPANPYAGTASLYIVTPNQQTFGAQAIAIGCIFPSPTP